MNKFYLRNGHKKHYKGMNNMKDNIRINLMLCTEYDSSRLPIAIISKSNNTACFKLNCESLRPQLP